MNQIATQTPAPTPIDPISQFRQELGMNMKRLEALLPQNISVERFCSVSMMAIQNNPELLDADRQSLLNEILKCAGDGLMPDNRDATLQIYSTKVKINGRETYIKKVQYMPMVRGIIKKIRLDTSIAEVIVDVIYEKDHYEIYSGDRNEIVHKPSMLKDRGGFVCAYAILKYKDGKRHQEVMRAEDITKARGVAKTDGVWAKWFDEKAKSSVLHRTEKRVDLPAEVRSFMQQTMEAEIADPGSKPAIENAPTPASNIEAALKAHREKKETPAIDHSPSVPMPEFKADENKEPQAAYNKMATQEMEIRTAPGEPYPDKEPEKKFKCERCQDKGSVEFKDLTGEGVEPCPDCSPKKPDKADENKL